MQANFCDCCGRATTAHLNDVHNSWPTFVNGVPQYIQMCQECAEAVDAFVLSIEGDFEEYETIKPEFSRVEVEDGE